MSLKYRPNEAEIIDQAVGNMIGNNDGEEVAVCLVNNLVAMAGASEDPPATVRAIHIMLNERFKFLLSTIEKAG